MSKFTIPCFLGIFVIMATLTMWTIRALEEKGELDTAIDTESINAIKRHVYGADAIETFDKHKHKMLLTGKGQTGQIIDGERNSHQGGVDDGEDAYTNSIDNALRHAVEGIMNDIARNT